MRLQNVRAAMAQLGADALFVTDPLNQRYLLGYPFTYGMLLITAKSAYMVTDFRYREEAEKRADPAFQVVTPAPRVPFVRSVLEEDGVKRIAYEDHSLTVAELHAFETFYTGFEFVPAGTMTETLRQVKDAAEVAAMTRAQEITDAAFSHFLSMAHPDMTEIDVALELDFFMRRSGAEGLAFETIAVSGDASALPHGHPRNVKLRPGFLTMDFGALYDGYCADMTRTVVIGRADAEMKRLYDTVLKAQKEALSFLHAGVKGADADAVARKIIEEEGGYKGCFGHGLGHAVGLFIHEAPRLSPSALDTVLVPGNVVTVEPGIYLEGKYGCRIEDMVLIEEGGIHDFTHSPKELIELF